MKTTKIEHNGFAYLVSEEKVSQHGIWAYCNFSGSISKTRNGQYNYKVVASTNPKLLADGIPPIIDSSELESNTIPSLPTEDGENVEDIYEKCRYEVLPHQPEKTVVYTDRYVKWLEENVKSTLSAKAVDSPIVDGQAQNEIIDNLIDSINVNSANFEHISHTLRINGTLRNEIKRVMIEFYKSDKK